MISKLAHDLVDPHSTYFRSHVMSQVLFCPGVEAEDAPCLETTLVRLSLRQWPES